MVIIPWALHLIIIELGDQKRSSWTTQNIQEVDDNYFIVGSSGNFYYNSLEFS